MKKIAVYAGSFAPVTLGHVDVVKRAALIFDQIVVGVTQNASKEHYISVSDRKNLLELALKDIKNVKVEIFDGLLVDFCKSVNADCIVKSVRNCKDFEYEKQFAEVNKQLSGIETFLLVADKKLNHISSSMVRELAKYNADISPFVPEGLAEKIIEVLKCS